jgi:ferritin-like metal-binding protein YciE
VIEQESDLTEHAHSQLDKFGGEIVLLEDVVESSQKRRLAKEIMNKVLELI